MAEVDEKLKKEVYDYLNELRLSGVTNMYGAVPYLVEEFAFEEKEAKKWLSDWMRDF